ncbi:hypothetical protein SELMODRAFT_405625 [Selaginella moellendorffii]|uniref:Uncharacterized protein n=1 Tax=Selaginella moellendorffii TaxID=88036 RepID=D8QZ66_SELML|nr:hypothetical protein SELMODRAFT_405625 [Selaginella moellendorffii]
MHFFPSSGRKVAARASGVPEHFLDEADASQQRASPTVYLLRKISLHRDVVGDYKKSLAFASRLQGGNFPKSIQVSFVERYNQQYTKEAETACDTATSKPEDVMLRHELKYLRSGDELELLPKARDEEEAVLPQTEPEARLDELVARLDKRLDENTQAAATGLEEIPRPWTEDTKLLVLTPEGIDLEVLEVTSPRSSSSDSYKRSSRFATAKAYTSIYLSLWNIVLCHRCNLMALQKQKEVRETIKKTKENIDLGLKPLSSLNKHFG